MPVLNPPFDGKPVHVGDAYVDRYLALGYSRVEGAGEKAEKSSSRRRKSD